jgi:hypothetical protein
MKAIHDCHAAVHKEGKLYKQTSPADVDTLPGAPRIASDIRIGTRVDKEIEPGTGNAHKVTRVEEILGKA